MRIQQLCALTRLQQLERMEQLERHECSYAEVPLPFAHDSCVLICDIPYINTNKYGDKSASFDYDAFYNWVRQSPYLIFICEYQMPEDFVCVAEIAHKSTLSATNNNKNTIERCFVHESKAHLVPQTSIFGY